MKFKEFFRVWKNATKLSEDVIELTKKYEDALLEIEYLKNQLLELKSELVVQKNLEK
jgi:hypothetical protein